jgi:DNA-binding transcriptional regulator GbsR (MarR family)
MNERTDNTKIDLEKPVSDLDKAKVINKFKDKLDRKTLFFSGSNFSSLEAINLYDHFSGDVNKVITLYRTYCRKEEYNVGKNKAPNREKIVELMLSHDSNYVPTKE